MNDAHTMKATWVKDLESVRGACQSVSLYRCDPGGPLPRHVIVSAICEEFAPRLLPFGESSLCETYIFAASEDGNVTNWTELPGSYKGGTDHETALRAAGYEVSR